MDSEKKTRTWLPLWVGVGIAIGIFIGNKYSMFTQTGAEGGKNKLSAVLNYINSSYVDKVDMNELVEDALLKIVQGLDPHSAYISAKDMKRVNEELEGQFSGIGVSFYVLRDTIVVTSIVPGGPSEAVGIVPGDRIVKVGDSIVAGTSITNDKVLKILRGEKGSEVTLAIKRSNHKDLKNIIVTRGNIPVKSIPVSYMLTDKIGYIKVETFASTTFNEFISAISKLKNLGSDSFVIDLRGNVGGKLDIVIAMVNEFLDKGQLIVYAEGRDFPRVDNYADGSGTCKKDQVVVLIDEMSASASEIFSGAIQDHDRGLVMGRKSFGKGLVQSQQDFPDGSAVRLTIARYYTPSGRSIQRKFEKGHYDEYEMTAINRYIQGDYANVDTTMNLQPAETDGGRTVYGGDGIMPDIFIPRDTLGINSYYNTLVNTGLLLDYAMVYSDMYRDKLDKFDSWMELYKHLLRQPLLDNLVSYADNKGVRPRPYYIQESSLLLEKQLYAFIIRNFFDEEGVYSILLKDDTLMRKSVEMIETGKATPQAVLSEQYKSATVFNDSRLFRFYDHLNLISSSNFI
ncbi:MAG: S41 family peptidase [Dysgonamonadaceae bacterium]